MVCKYLITTSMFSYTFWADIYCFINDFFQVHHLKEIILETGCDCVKFQAVLGLMQHGKKWW